MKAVRVVGGGDGVEEMKNKAHTEKQNRPGSWLLAHARPMVAPCGTRPQPAAPAALESKLLGSPALGRCLGQAPSPPWGETTRNPADARTSLAELTANHF